MGLPPEALHGRRRILSRAAATGIAAIVAVLSAASVRSQPVPPLPTLPLETYEPGIREPISEAYRAAQEKPKDAARNGRLGMLLYAAEQYELAAACFERARAFAPDDAAWAYYLGRTQVYLARSEAAAASLRAALRLRPGYLPARLMLAKSLLDAGQTDESRALYRSLVDEHPDAAEAHYGLGRIDAARGDPAAAVERLEKACALFPGFGAAHFALARAYRDLGDKEKAQEQLALYQKDKLGWPSVEDPLLAAVHELKTGANARLSKGIELAESGDVKAAAEEHEKALQADPKLVRAHVNLIRLYGMLGEPEKAAEHYRAAVALDPHLAEAHNNYAYLLMTSGKLEEAAARYRDAIDSKPDYRLAHFNLGRILVQQGRLAEGIEHLRQTLGPDDDETPLYTYALGAALARAGRREEALRYMREAREKAAARGQAERLGSIERDLRALEQGTSPR
jgi:tetratricopeptide (TPR) repeat protein